MTHLLSKVFLVFGGCMFAAMAHAQTKEVLVPTVFEAGHFYTTPTARTGYTPRLIVDTGGAGFGGLYAIRRDIVSRLGGTVTTCKQPDFKVDIVGGISFRTGAGLPSVTQPRPCGADAVILDADAGVKAADGMLGAGYLSHFIWTFDYPAKKLLIEPQDWHPDPHAVRVPLSFVHNQNGERGSDFPAVALMIDGEPVPLLFDTGATAFPTPAGLTAQHIPTVKGEGVTSYIIKSVFEKWHAHHPEWRIIENGDSLIQGMRLIEVPEVTLGTQRVGPVWFTERPDRNFGPERMSLWMGQTVVGAAGANLYGRFRITVDYPHEALWIDPSCQTSGSTYICQHG
ncbi:hypothetical protein K6W36_12635 [Acetobacter senegalensis]|uniref:hypothetical protein n=1 Tax=Acetobacter senegalensis TaxID=446692 RepID=UPI001EDB7053|nr:hypothetical protein [Acetobacter senegalensis]MCG4261412.1 hypothetical protein [Acetobacter senegalensis]